MKKKKHDLGLFIGTKSELELVRSDTPFAGINQMLKSDSSLKSFSKKTNIDMLGDDKDLKMKVKISALIHQIIRFLSKMITNQYRLRVPKILNQSKKVNDLYDKVNDLLMHDKLARAKHSLDKVDATGKYPVLVDTKEKNVYYQPICQMGIDIMAFQKYVDRVCSRAISDRSTSLKTETNLVITTINKNIEEKFPYIYNKDRYKTYVKSEDYSDVTFGIALNTYKQCIEKTYQLLNRLLTIFSTQLQYLQICELAYKRLTTSYGENKACKDFIDSVFREVLKFQSQAADFNNCTLKIIDELYVFYVDEMDQLYAKIREN